MKKQLKISELGSLGADHKRNFYDLLEFGLYPNL